MKELKIRLGDSAIAILKPVPFANLQSLETLLEEIMALWLKYDAAVADLLLSEDGQVALDISQKIVNLHPRSDVRDTCGFDITPLKNDLSQFEQIFLCDRDESDNLSALKGGLITKLNRFNPVKRYQRAAKLLADREVMEQQSQALETSGVTS